MGFFSKKKGTTITQEPLLAPEQGAAMSALAEFYKTGKLGNYQAGEAYKGSLGEFDMTDLEKQGQSKLGALVSGGYNDLFSAGKDEILKLLKTDKFDPYAKGGTYSGFSEATDRATQEGTDALKRNLAVTGDLYSTATGKEAGLLQERGVQNKQNALASLYQNFSNQKIAGAGTAVDMGVKQEAIDQGRIGLTQTYGSLQRLLQDAQAKAKYADYLRGRTELSSTLDAARTLATTEVPYGVKSFTTPDSPSPFSNLLNAGLNIAGQAAGAYLTGGTSLFAGGLGGGGGSTSPMTMAGGLQDYQSSLLSIFQ